MKKYLFGQKHYYMYTLETLFDSIVALFITGTFFAKLTTSLACAATIFLSPTHFALPFVLFTVLYNLGHAAYNVGYTVVYRILPERHYASGLAIGVIPQSLVFFFSTLALAPLFNYLKDDLGGTLFGRTFYAQQTFSIIGTAFYILGILYLVFVTNRHMLPLIGKGEEREKRLHALSPRRIKKHPPPNLS